jgi:DNA-binding CsgD family transcriptional regulator
MSRLVALITLMALQALCGLFLLSDVLGTLFGVPITPISWALYELIEIGAILGLILGALASASIVLRATRAQRRAEDSLRMASGAFMEVVEDRFAEWGLTPAERDVALFSIKGMTTPEIAALRDTSEGTVKAQTNAIYRKADVSGRHQLLSLFIDDLMSGPIDPAKPNHPPP